MGFITIDESKCNKDELCVKECPFVLLRMNKETGFPEMVPGGEDACLVCGHCLAVCPTGALDHSRTPLNACPSIKKDLDIELDHAVQFLRSRRSIRFFKDRPVERETLQRLIEIARYAPTASNAQPVKWIVHDDRDKIRELSRLTVEWMRKVVEKYPAEAGYMPLIIGAWDMGFDAVLRQAPVVVTAYAHKSANNGLVDVSLALSYLDLAAPKMGLGGCWAGLLQAALINSKDVREAMGLPEDHPHHYPIMLGRPKFKYHRLPERKTPVITWM